MKIQQTLLTSLTILICLFPALGHAGFPTPTMDIVHPSEMKCSDARKNIADIENKSLSEFPPSIIDIGECVHFGFSSDKKSYCSMDNVQWTQSVISHINCNSEIGSDCSEVKVKVERSGKVIGIQVLDYLEHVYVDKIGSSLGEPSCTKSKDSNTHFAIMNNKFILVYVLPEEHFDDSGNPKSSSTVDDLVYGVYSQHSIVDSQGTWTRILSEILGVETSEYNSFDLNFSSKVNH